MWLLLASLSSSLTSLHCTRQSIAPPKKGPGGLEVLVLETRYLVGVQEAIQPVTTPRAGALVLAFQGSRELSGTTDERGMIRFPQLDPTPQEPVTVVVMGESGLMVGVSALTMNQVTLYYPLPPTVMVVPHPSRITTEAGIVQGVVTRWTPYSPLGKRNRAEFYTHHLSDAILLEEGGKREAFLSTEPPPTFRQCLNPWIGEAEEATTFYNATVSGGSLRFFRGGGVTMPIPALALSGGPGIYSLLARLAVSRNDLSIPLAELRIVSGSDPVTQGINNEPSLRRIIPFEFVTSSTLLSFDLTFYWNGSSSLSFELRRVDEDANLSFWLDRIEVAPYEECMVQEDPYLGPTGVRFPVPEGSNELAMVERLVDTATNRIEEVLSLAYVANLSVPRGVTQTLTFEPEILPDYTLCQGVNPEGRLALHLLGLERRFYTPDRLERLEVSLSLRSPLGLKIPLFPDQSYTFRELEQSSSTTDQVLYFLYPFGLTGALSGFTYHYRIRMSYHTATPEGIPVTISVEHDHPTSFTSPCTLTAPMNFPHAEPLTASASKETGISLHWQVSPALLVILLNQESRTLTLYSFSKEQRELRVPLSLLGFSFDTPILVELRSYWISQALTQNSDFPLTAFLTTLRRSSIRATLVLGR